MFKSDIYSSKLEPYKMVEIENLLGVILFNCLSDSANKLLNNKPKSFFVNDDGSFNYQNNFLLTKQKSNLKISENDAINICRKFMLSKNQIIKKKLNKYGIDSLFPEVELVSSTIQINR
ncbi:MAG: hypothetical protein KDC67_06770, partial [Ignavibacteriae bacterium]|nr:hypothetical protein [Ignavibacteriota bacterium]